MIKRTDFVNLKKNVRKTIKQFSNKNIYVRKYKVKNGVYEFINIEQFLSE